jgi:hypothetical protein
VIRWRKERKADGLSLTVVGWVCSIGGGREYELPLGRGRGGVWNACWLGVDGPATTLGRRDPLDDGANMVGTPRGAGDHDHDDHNDVEDDGGGGGGDGGGEEARENKKGKEG